MMFLSEFIRGCADEILAAWESDADKHQPASPADRQFWREQAREALDDMALRLDGTGGSPSAAERAGGEGFNDEIAQAATDFLALRRCVLALWQARRGDAPDDPAQLERLHAALDLSMAQTMGRLVGGIDRSRDTFAAILGHDLRSPLNAISASSQALAGTALDPRQVRAVDAIQKGVGTMTVMIQDLLEFSRLRLGAGIPVLARPDDLARVCREALEEIQAAYPEQEFSFRCSGDTQGSFDGMRLHQVVSNLVTNGVKHGSRGGTIQIWLDGTGPGLRLDVRSDGPAIPEEALRVVFDPMARLGMAGNGGTSPSRMGLGLFIAREIVAAHGGTLSVAPGDGSGTCFSIALPRLVGQGSAGPNPMPGGRIAPPVVERRDAWRPCR